MSHSTHGGFLLQRYCPWGKLGFRLLSLMGFYRGRTPTKSHRSHIISVDVTSGLPCPRLSKSIISIVIVSIYARNIFDLMVKAPYIPLMNEQVLRRNG